MATTYTVTFKFSVDQSKQSDSTSKTAELTAILAHFDKIIPELVPMGVGLSKATYVSYKRS